MDTPRNKSSQPKLSDALKAGGMTRRFAQFSIIFGILALVCIGFLTFIYYREKKTHPDLKNEPTHLVETKAITFDFPALEVVLPNEQELRVEMTMECSMKETCEFIKANQEQSRDLLIPVLSHLQTEDYMNAEYKKLIRKKLADRLNSMEMPGKVIQIHFTNLNIEGHGK